MAQQELFRRGLDRHMALSKRLFLPRHSSEMVIWCNTINPI